MAGDQMLVVEDAAAARDVAQRRQRLDREAKSRRGSRGGVTLEDFMAQSTPGGQHSLRMDRVTPGQRTFCVGQIDPFALRRILHTGARLCDRVGRVPTRTRIGEPFRAQHDGIVGPP